MIHTVNGTHEICRHCQSEMVLVNDRWVCREHPGTHFKQADSADEIKNRISVLDCEASDLRFEINQREDELDIIEDEIARLQKMLKAQPETKTAVVPAEQVPMFEALA